MFHLEKVNQEKETHGLKKKICRETLIIVTKETVEASMPVSLDEGL